MIGRLARWLSVRFGAWAIGRGMSAAELLTAITKAFPHRDQEWRLELLGEITDRAHARKVLR